MSEDVVEFGGSAERTVRRPSRFHVQLPKLPAGIGVTLACAGAVAAIVSFLGRWPIATYNVPTGRNTPVVPDADREITYAADTTLYGFAYIVILLVITVSVVIALRGAAAAQQTARLAGLASSGFLLVFLAIRAYTFSLNPYRIAGYLGPQNEVDSYTTRLDWGLYAAFAAAILVMAALVLRPQPLLQDEEPEPVELIEYDEADELTVLVEPTPAVSPSHELYMRK
jgi:hypothetical protein